MAGQAYVGGLSAALALAVLIGVLGYTIGDCAGTGIAYLLRAITG